MGRRSSLREDFLDIKTRIGLRVTSRPKLKFSVPRTNIPNNQSILYMSRTYSYNRRHSSGSGTPPKGSTLDNLNRAAAAAVAVAAAGLKSCFDLAENQAASSLSEGAYRCTWILCVSKFLWV